MQNKTNANRKSPETALNSKTLKSVLVAKITSVKLKCQYIANKTGM